jgi:ubiquinone/menaquinone biosynthesis C-methylase UbiE
MAEWLTSALDLRPGMRVLDLGCGRATSSIFLHREIGVQVWATDLWFSAAENGQRIRDAGVEDSVFPVDADARSLPFSDEFFDVIVSLDSFYYYGTDDLYLNYLALFVRPGGAIGMAGGGLMQEIDSLFRNIFAIGGRTISGACTLVAPPLGAHQNYGHRDRGYDAGRLPALAGLAQAHSPRQ